mmetsp:Transcript_10000/g.24933  ORF Transcript_10000/g.24933 Transcript_10000/m.24933 type:complete len:402 (-) Transcript_10000:46-1251(-)
MAQQWEVVGGSDKGGILVREGQDLKSPATKDRLSTGALVEQLELKGERLQYKLITGTGPATGWVSLKVTGKDLLIKKDGAAAGGSGGAPADSEDVGGPGEDSGPVEVDEELKKKIEAMAAKKKEEDLFPLYLMKYKVLGYPLAAPKLRVLCFHNAGSAESNYTGVGTPFMAWNKECKQIEICAFDFPGRDKLLKYKKHESIETLAPDLMSVFYEKMNDGVPYIIWGHSVGTWVSFEFLMLARKLGLPMPLAAFWMAFPAPHMPEAQRNWHKNRGMNDKEFRKELLDWDPGHFGGAGKVVFDEPGWEDTWKPLMRADFCLFDEYKFKHNGAPKFSFPIHSWHMEAEIYNKADQIEMWKDWTTGNFDFQIMKGMGHLTCFYKPDFKKEYFTKVTELMKQHAGL